MHSGVAKCRSRMFSFMTKHIYFIILCLLLMPWEGHAKRVTPKDALRDSVLQRIYTYVERTDTTGLRQHISYNYTKFQMRTNRSNLTLLMVPTMYAVAKSSGKKFLGEYYTQVTIDKNAKFKTHRLLNINTIPHRRNAMPSVLNYLTPNIYGEQLFQENILSPFNRKNKKFYSFFLTILPYGRAQLYAYPRLKNTQLVRARAIVNRGTGKIEMVDFEGEYDMTRFYISVVMKKEEGYLSLLPSKCDLKANFRFMGNDINAMYTSVYGLPKQLSDSLNNAADTALMSKVRPIPLNEDEKSILKKYYGNIAKRDSINKSKGKDTNFVKDVLWDAVGDNVLNRIRQNFGKNDQGYVRLDPILNPLYMGYSHRKGLVYKFDVRGSYSFNDNWQIWLRFKAGYSFKQHLFYYRIPAVLNYNKKHNGYLEVEVGNGNRINSNLVARNILGVSLDKDSLNLIPREQYTEFKDNYLRITNHWMFAPRIGFEIGLVSHHREATHPDFYVAHNYPISYRSVAPAIALEWHPIGRRGPVLKVDYERSYKGLFGSNIKYERLELDAQAIIHASRRRSFSLRGGTGFYTKKGDHWYFVDYTNFRDNNIPGGWNDEWSGEFELLNSSWYNASEYYVRTNATYEAPIVFAAWMPLFGRYIEKERLYVNSLVVKHLHPYTEWGYGFSTRLMSIGFFAAFHNTKFDGVGCRWGFELFRNW